MRRRSGGPGRLAFAGATVAFLSLAACQVIAGIEDRSTGSDAGNGGKTGFADSSADGPNGQMGDDTDATCVLAHIEGPPTAIGDGGADDISIIAVMEDVTLPGTSGSKVSASYGLDLDGVCTCCDGGCSSANQGTCKPNGGATVCDFASGIDNTGATLISDFQQFNNGMGTAFSELSVNAGIVTGKSSIMMQIRNYNGQTQDDSVELSFFVSTGFQPQDGGATLPQFDGTDIWDYSDQGVMDVDAAVPTDFPSFHSTSAYVSNSTLNANLSTLDITIGDVAMHLVGVQIKAQMEQDDGSGTWHLTNGIMGARWPLSSILERFGNANLNPDCTPSATYSALKLELCPFADVTADPGQGGNGTMAPSALPTCSAMSMQIGFSAVSAHFGSPESAIVEPTPCPGFVYECP